MIAGCFGDADYNFNDSNLLKEFSIDNFNYFQSQKTQVFCSNTSNNNYLVLVFGEIYRFKDLKISNNSDFLKLFIQDIDNTNISSLLKKINGEFIIIIYNKLSSDLIIARDQLGFIPLYYTFKNSNLLFSSHLKVLYKESSSEIKLNEKWFFNGLSDRNLKNIGTTAFSNINILPNAHYLYFSNKKITIHKYWNLDIDNIHTQSKVKSYHQSFKEFLTNSILGRIENKSNIACELSGGIDSSTIACTVADNSKKNNQDLFAFSHVLENSAKDKIFPYNDEQDFSNLVIEKYPNIKHIKLSKTNQGILSILRITIKKLGYAPYNIYNYYTSELLDICENQNINTVLSGHGGDQVVSNQGLAYLKELIYKFKYSKIYPFILQTQQYYGISKFKLLISIFSQVYLSGLKNLLKKNKFATSKLLSKHIVKNNIKCHKESSISKRNINTMNKGLHQMLYYHSNMHRIEVSNEISLLNGILYKYPLLDVELLKYYFSIPSEIKANPHQTRHFIREATKTLLPEQIRTRNDKTGSTIPSIQYSYLLDYDEITEFILYCNSNLKNQFIDCNKMLEWHKVLKNRTNNSGEIRMTTFLKALSNLIFIDLFERGQL